jgi:hypothetical protein
MSIREFLYGADALMAEEGVSFHVETGEKPLPSPADNRRRNADAMAAFTAMMGGVQKKGRRR